VTEIAQMPTTEHWAVVYDESFTYDDGYGDDRHGKSYSTKSYMTYLSFDNVEQVIAWIHENENTKYGSPKTFRVLHVKPGAVNKQVSISIE
jgi:hypothetical protein